MEITINQQKQLSKFAQQNGIKFVVLFGSRTKEKPREDSDYDIAVLTIPDKNIKSSLDNYNNVLFGLSEILSIPDYKLDLTNLNEVNILLKYHITSSGVLLYGNEIDLEELKADAYRDYIDARPLFNLERILIYKKQKILSGLLAKK